MNSHAHHPPQLRKTRPRHRSPLLAPHSVLTSASTQPPAAETARPASDASLGPIKQINAGLLNIGYAEAGPADGPAVILLHGWPYDIHAFVDVAPIMAAKGYRVIIPHLRGHGEHHVSFREHYAQRPTRRRRSRHHCPHGRAENSASADRRF